MSDNPKLSILIPCLNESANLTALAARLDGALSGLGVSFELVLVDDGSVDDTYAAAIRLKEKHPWITAVRHTQNQGIAEGWASAFAASRGEYVLTMDADLQYRPEDIPAIWSEMQRSGVELVQGWRAESVGGSKTRRVMSILFSVMLNSLFGTNLKDIKSGFILYKRNAFGEILKDRKQFRYFQHFPTIAAKSRGYDIKQVPVAFDVRFKGQSFIKSTMIFGLKSLVDLPKALRMYRR